MMSLFIYCARCGHTRSQHGPTQCNGLEAGKCPCIGWTARIEEEGKCDD